MKDDVNDEMPNGTLKFLIPSNGGGKLGWGVETIKGILSFAIKNQWLDVINDYIIDYSHRILF